ncbi:hypothetical protein [Roseomonas populi]|uniref:Uncharacterized protein n=1 Tax=Roseomonas populi TaxID=3121582 RepID=A0ABT1XAM9_9PROT|nr:hypothetical protein [Roseomonas pecuniae]MCR0984483.1 hypothetical protein [Roseomonas pecuniae]
MARQTGETYRESLQDDRQVPVPTVEAALASDGRHAVTARGMAGLEVT